MSAIIFSNPMNKQPGCILHALSVQWGRASGLSRKLETVQNAKVARKEKNNIDQNEKRLLEIQEVAKKESPRIEDP